MIQSAQVASKFTLFTHHAKTFPDLVTALRNSMLRAGVFKDERTAEEQVVQVLNFDIHLVKDFRGIRYIERITECIPVEEKNEYTFDHRKQKTLEGKLDKFMDNAAIFFGKTTNRELYKYRNVMEYVNDGYVLTNPISDNNIKEMRINMEDTDMAAFDAFLERNWGIKPPQIRTDSEPVPQDIDDLTKETVPVSANPVQEKTASPKADTVATTQTATARKTPQTAQARPAQKRPVQQNPTQARPTTKPTGTTAKKPVNPTQAKAKPDSKPKRSSILGKFDDDEE